MKNRLKRLLNTTAVKLSLKYSIIYISIFGLVFIILYYFISFFVQDQIKASLIQESKRIERLYKTKGLKAVEKYVLSHKQYKGEDHRYYLLIYNKKLIGDLKKWPNSLSYSSQIQNVWISQENIKGKVPDGDGYWPMIAIKLGKNAKLLIAQGIKGTEDLRETLFTIMAVMFGIVVILTMGLGLSLGRKMVGHIETIEKASKQIINGDLTSRIEISNRNDEFDTIARQLNKMLDKIEKLIMEEKNTINNIAHDLKNPLNRVRTRLELALINRKTERYQEAIERTVEDIDQIMKIFDSLLTIAEAEAETAKTSWERVDLNEIIDSMVEFYYPLAEDKSICMELQIEEGLFIPGNKHLLSQAIGNIIDNAIKFTPTNGKITIKAFKTKNEKIEISICDSGVGVKNEEYDKITKPFYRSDPSRHTPGNGLGLSLVKAVADLHNALLKFSNNNPGLCVKLIFLL